MLAHYDGKRVEDFRNLLLAVWREVCRHIEITESTETIAALLAKHMPIDHVRVLAFDWARGHVVTRATGLAPVGAAHVEQEISTDDARELADWANSGTILRNGSPPRVRVLRLMAPDAGEGSWLIGALRNDDGPTGAVALRAKPPASFEASHETMLAELLEPLSAALENDRRIHELAALREAAEADKRRALARLGRIDLRDTLVGVHGGLEPVMSRVALVARSDMPVLLLGETGTGKEVIARAIHDASPRARGPFIRVNCGAIPSELIDSELFGHERGAFTGATASRRGWFERADEGTLLLDEVGELPLPAQVRLLRVLQEGTFERVGGEKAVAVDVRIIAATHRDLPVLVQNGQFREDLWYRIAGFPIVLPPLRERRADIPALAAHFAERAALRFGLRPVAVTRQDVALLQAYDWPGNVRELASVIDRAAILGDGESLEIAKALGAPQSQRREQPAASRLDRALASSLVSLDEAMRNHIERALEHCHGRIEGVNGAAKLLGINPHTLRARMRKLAIEWGRFRTE